MKAKNAPNKQKAERFAATSVRLRTAEPGTSGDRDRASIPTKADSITTDAAISPDGWFRSGDLARRDADGWYYIVDRTKDLIIRGGFNVYPRELEEVLLTHPAVSLAAVVGVPHDSHGEEVKAYVVRTAGAELTEAELIAWCKQNMAAYKYPRVVEFRDSLPMTATGKILKRELVVRP